MKTQASASGVAPEWLPRHGEQLVLPDETERLVHLARYLTRPPLASRRLREGARGTHLLETPPDPGTGATELALDRLWRVP